MDTEAGMTPDERAVFAASVAGVTARYWARAADAGTADADGAKLPVLWAAGADQGWLALGEADAAVTAKSATMNSSTSWCTSTVSPRW